MGESFQSVYFTRVTLHKKCEPRGRARALMDVHTHSYTIGMQAETCNKAVCAACPAACCYDGSGPPTYHGKAAAASTTKSPEEVRVGTRICCDNRAVRQDGVERDHVVDAVAEVAVAERQA